MSPITLQPVSDLVQVEQVDRLYYKLAPPAPSRRNLQQEFIHSNEHRVPAL